MRMSLEFAAFFFLTLPMAGTTCPDLCMCDGNVLKCERPDIPEDIPVNVTHVYVTKLNLNNLNTETFQQAVWKHVTLLDLHAEEGETIGDRSFKQLKRLESFGLHCDELTKISPSAFEGLDKVRRLDLSNNYNLRMERILPVLEREIRHGFQSLEDLILARLNSRKYEPLNLDYEFMRSLSYSNTLKFLDISHTNIGLFDGSHLYLLCNSIEHIKLHGVAIAYPKDFIGTTPNCRSLRTLDMTNTVLSVTRQPWHITSDLFECESNANVYDSIETLILTGVSEADISVDIAHADMTNCSLHMKKIVLNRNHIKWFNASVTLSESLRNSIYELDLSENGLEFFSPEAIFQDENLQILRLSKNNLHAMLVKHREDFARLFHKSRQLRELYIADNKLVNMPRHIFDNNLNLEYIDLSGNRLQTLDFEIRQLKNLRHLDLANNWISIIDKNTYSMIDILYREISTIRQPVDSKTNSTLLHQTPIQEHEYFPLQVNLGYNKYKCSCKDESYYSVEWLQNAKPVYRNNTQYMCDFQGETLDMLTSTNRVTKTKCAHQTVMYILMISIPTVVITITSLALIVVLVRRRQRIRQRRQDFLGELENDNFNKTFLAFLSYCSEDSDFVMDHIYPQMRESLSELTKTSKTFVCIGDREFHLGLRVHAEVTRCMEESSVVIFVVSKQFCNKDWCRMEVGEAYDQCKPIVLIMKEYVEISEMPKVLSRIFNRYTHASWVNDNNGGHLEPNMNIISKSIIELARKAIKAEICTKQDVQQDI